MLDTDNKFGHLLSYPNVGGYCLTRRNLLGLIRPPALEWFIVMPKASKELDVLKHHLSKNSLKLTRQREYILNTFSEDGACDGRTNVSHHC